MAPFDNAGGEVSNAYLAYIRTDVAVQASPQSFSEPLRQALPGLCLGEQVAALALEERIDQRCQLPHRHGRVLAHVVERPPDGGPRGEDAGDQIHYAHSHRD